MQLKICIKRSLAHILCSYAKKRCDFKQRSANNRQQTGPSGAVSVSHVYPERMLTVNGKAAGR
ncbi:hypothetical protein ELE31_26200 [Klebsiella quasipneumoniae]|nr:hypothetical protein [Klebsiella quasipneumoniae]MBM5569706.1 hypothetical protein [Klebsiella quasipneumoniae]